MNDLQPVRQGKALQVGLWLAQTIVAVMFVLSGGMKIAMPIPELSRMLPWTGQLPLAFVRTIGAVDLAGGVGILLPSLTGIRPGLTVAAAIGCSALQVCAIFFHVSRGEAALTPLNFLLLGCATFVAWGKRRR